MGRRARLWALWLKKRCLNRWPNGENCKDSPTRSTHSEYMSASDIAVGNSAELMGDRPHISILWLFLRQLCIWLDVFASLMMMNFTIFNLLVTYHCILISSLDMPSDPSLWKYIPTTRQFPNCWCFCLLLLSLLLLVARMNSRCIATIKSTITFVLYCTGHNKPTLTYALTHTQDAVAQHAWINKLVK